VIRRFWPRIIPNGSWCLLRGHGYARRCLRAGEPDAHRTESPALAADYDEWGHGQTNEHWKQFENYLEDPAANPPPDGYAPLFYKADRAASPANRCPPCTAVIAGLPAGRRSPLGEGPAPAGAGTGEGLSRGGVRQAPGPAADRRDRRRGRCMPGARPPCPMVELPHSAHLVPSFPGPRTPEPAPWHGRLAPQLRPG
jgi:hypothetical protein